MSAFRAFVVIIDADDGRIVRAFRLEHQAVTFVAAEHLRRWDCDADHIRPGMDFESADLYRCTFTESELIDTYETAEKLDGDALGWKDPARNKIAEAYTRLATSLSKSQ